MKDMFWNVADYLHVRFEDVALTVCLIIIPSVVAFATLSQM